MLSEILQLQIGGDYDGVTALTALACQAVHQVGLDKGSWENAVFIIPTSDPLSRPVFGADEQTLQEVHRYRRALKELRSHTTSTRDDAKEENGDDRGGRWKAKPKAKEGTDKK